jgi:hypothetical protein
MIDLDTDKKKQNKKEVKHTDQSIDDEEDILNEESLLEKFNREEINKEFRKRIKKYYIFKVIKTPCIQDLAEYITFNTDLRSNEE